MYGKVKYKDYAIRFFCIFLKNYSNYLFVVDVYYVDEPDF